MFNDFNHARTPPSPLLLLRWTGGFSGNVGHDSHLLYTLSAVQILAIYDALDVLDTDALVAWVAGLQQDDGSFWGDKWGEVGCPFFFLWGGGCLAGWN